MNHVPETPTIRRSLFLAAAVGLVFSIFLVLFSYLIEGLQLATRSATELVMPVGLIWVAMFTGMVFFALQRNRPATLSFVLGFLFVSITGNPYLSSKFIQSVEWPEVEPQATPENPYRTVVVLGGAATTTSLQTPELQRDGERLFSAAQLWHAGLVSSVICTGSASDGVDHPRDLGSVLLESVGVPSEVIYRIPGENTSQEMAGVKAFFADPPADFPKAGDDVLITSAFHLPRAMRLAKKHNLVFDPLPCGYRSGFFSRFSPRAMIPKAEATANFGTALKERLGGLVGR